MRVLLFFGLIVSALSGLASEGATRTMQLDNGQELVFKQIQHSRILPHSYYDQAIESISLLYPDAQMLAQRRLGYLGESGTILYSLVCYKQSADMETVAITGVVTLADQAWTFNASASDTVFGDTLALVLESISRLSFK